MYENVLQSIDNQIADLNKTREFIATMPELALPADGEGYYWITGDARYVGVNLPYNHKLIKENAAVMEAAGYSEIYRNQTTDDGILHINYRKGDWHSITIDFFYRPANAGSTCKLNLIGYEKKPVYEVTCMDAEPLVQVDSNIPY